MPAAVAATIVTADAHERFAKATLRAADGTRVDTVAFEVVIVPPHRGHRPAPSRGQLEAFHGFHIHANDVSTNGDGCIADPAQPCVDLVRLGRRPLEARPDRIHGHHAGDLPSLFVNADGTASMPIHVDKLTAGRVIGRAVVLHAGADNFGNVPVGPGTRAVHGRIGAVAKTQATGNAGDRVACGVIGKG